MTTERQLRASVERIAQGRGLNYDQVSAAPEPLFLTAAQVEMIEEWAARSAAGGNAAAVGVLSQCLLWWAMRQ